MLKTAFLSKPIKFKSININFFRPFHEHLYINMRGISLTNKKLIIREGLCLTGEGNTFVRLTWKIFVKRFFGANVPFFFAKSKVCSKHDERKLFFFSIPTGASDETFVHLSIQTFNINCCLSS